MRFQDDPITPPRYSELMLIIAVTDKEKAQPKNDLLSVKKDDLNICPSAAQEADFLQMMDGWL